MNVKPQKEHLNRGYGIQANGLLDSTSNLFVEIPSHWEIKRLQFISQKVQTGTTPPTTSEEYYQNGTIDWFAPSDFHENQIYLKKAKKKLNEKALQDGIVKCFPRGSILVIGIGATLGKVGLLDIDATSNQQINAILLNKDIEPKFVAYHLSVLQEIMKVISSATTIGILNQEKTKLIPLAIPPLNEQKLIVDYLDRETTQIDNLIAAKEQMLTLLEEKREALISKAVTRGLDPNVAFKRSGLDWLGDIPEHWQVSRAKFVSNIFVPQRNKPELNTEDGIPWLTMEDMHFKRVSNTTFKVSQEASKLAGSKILKRGSVIASCVGNFGICTINDVDLIINQQLQAFIPHKHIMAEYLCELVKVSTNYFKMIGASVTIVYVNQFGFENMPVLLPPKEEQEQIVEHLNREIGKMDELLAAIKESIALLKERRAALITAAVTGQIALEDMS